MRAIRIKLALLTFLLAGVSAQAQLWKSLDGGIPGTATALTSNAGLLAVAYSNGYDNKQKVHEVAIWNGVYWYKLPPIYSDSTSTIRTLFFKDSGLYIAGSFTEFNKLNDVRNIVHWKNGSYRALPPLATSNAKEEVILNLNSLGSKLVVTGSFKNTKLNTGNNIAFFEDGQWVEPGIQDLLSINGAITSSIVHNGRLVLGGFFTKVGGTKSNYIAGFNIKHSLTREKNEHIPYKMVPYDTSIFFWGQHGTKPQDPPSFFVFNADTLYETTKGISKILRVTDLFINGSVIYAIGEFEMEGVATAQHMIQYEDGKWQVVPGGHFQGLTIGTSWRGQVIGSGWFQGHRGIALKRIAQFMPGHGAVKGKVYFDRDENCEFSSNDRPLNDRLVYIEPGGVVARPDEDGNFLTYLKEGKYTFSVLPRNYWKASPCDVLQKSVYVEEGIVTDTTDFALVQTISIRDLAVKLFAQSGPVAPRKNVQLYYIKYENLGSNEVDNGKVTLHFDQKLQDLAASPMPDEVKGDSATWYFSLRPGISEMIKCAFVLEENATEKLNLMAKVTQEGQTPDADSDNNESSLTQTITEEEIEIGKFVNPGEAAGDTAYIEPGTKSVEYQISFSNYSTDTVRTVYVVDTIGLNHSIQEIRETGASHPYSYQIIPGQPGENVATVIWTFHNIDLAPNPNKNGEVVSDDGFIGFSIGLKPGLENGTMLSNTAHVAFDYSDQKSSNEVYALVDEPGSVDGIPENELNIYPNPTNGILNVSGIDVLGWQYDIIGINGGMISKGVIGSDHKIDITHINQGLYVLRLHTTDGEIHQRIIRR